MSQKQHGASNVSADDQQYNSAFMPEIAESVFSRDEDEDEFGLGGPSPYTATAPVHKR